MFKLAATIASTLVGLGLTTLYQPPPPDDGPPPPKSKKERDDPKAKKGGPKAKKDAPGPASDLGRAYELLRRIRGDGGGTGRPEERLRDWTDRATKFYRDGVRAFDGGDHVLAHEYGAAAHDLARAVDHARNAARFDRGDPDLPPPPDGPGPGDARGRSRADLRRAFDRINETDRDVAPRQARVFVQAARDLYTAARGDAEAGRDDRAGELARAAEAMTHVTEHLTHAAGAGGDVPEPGGRRLRTEPPDAKKARPEPPDAKKARPDRDRDRDDDLPPPLRDTPRDR